MRHLRLFVSIFLLPAVVVFVYFFISSAPAEEITEPRPFIDISSVLNHFGPSLKEEQLFGTGVAVADFNGDGLDDIFLPSHNNPLTPRSFFGDYQEFTNKLFVNLGDTDGDGIPEFREAARPAGVAGDDCQCTGVAVGDYDNDGRLDLYVTAATRGYVNPVGFRGSALGGFTDYINHGFPASPQTDGFYECEGRNILYRNEGNNEESIPFFVDVTDEAGVADCRNGTSAAFADFDLDGFLDIYVGNVIDSDFFSFKESFFNGARDTLFRNVGNGTFVDVTEEMGVAGRPLWSYTPDGERVSAFNPALEDSRGRPAGSDHSNTLAVGFIDYNDDRYPDLVSVSDTPGVISVFYNDRGRKFIDVSDEAGTNLSGAWMGIAFGDVDGDGRLDMFNTNWGSEYFTRRAPAYIPNERRVSTGAKKMLWGKAQYSNALWRFVGTRSFDKNGVEVRYPLLSELGRAMIIDWREFPPRATEPSFLNSDYKRTPLGLEESEFGFGAVFLDFDNDSRNDIYWTGSLYNEGAGRLLQNLGGNGLSWRDATYQTRTFNVSDASYETGLDMNEQEWGRGVAKGDLNDDGYADIVITNIGGFRLEAMPEPSYKSAPTLVFLNPGYENNWLKVRLEGTKSNKSAVGAVVRVHLPNGRVLVDQVSSGTSFLSNNSLTLIFGLGDFERAEKITVDWPYTGSTTTLYNVKGKRTVSITEKK